uniref:AlNc14C11G1368 protein n=1 Tax=Albugo laibachii Nc14 TaxID=890382 RepID=F0W2Y9_9STRA|nr:AlNc14C11G1368 [Albugo laibachii Nc14]|eukprot:CCA15426.1 AlNc14C11G1368 [Albugo laibachii Nc14]
MSTNGEIDATAINGQKRITHDLLLVTSSCDALMGLRLKWEAEANPRCVEKTAFRFSNEVYLFDGFLVLYHNQSEMPSEFPALEYTRDNIKCRVAFVPEEIPPFLMSSSVEDDERHSINPEESKALYLLQHYLFAQLLGIQPIHLISPRDDLPLDHVHEVADFHIVPRFILVTNATVENMEALHDPRRIGFGSGALLPLKRILEYLEMSSRFAATAFLAEFEPSQLIDCIVSTRVNGEPAAFRVDAVVTKTSSAKMEHVDQKDSSSGLTKNTEDAELPRQSTFLEHLGQGSDHFDGSSKAKLIAKWEEEGPFLQISPKVEKESHLLDPDHCNLTGLRTDVFELGTAMPLILKYIRYCKLLHGFAKKFKSCPKDMAFLLRACTHASFFDLGMQSVNTVEATIARVRMGHVFLSENMSKKRKLREFDTDHDIIAKKKLDSESPDYRQDFPTIRACSQDRLAFLGNHALKFLAAFSLSFKIADGSDNPMEQAPSVVLDETVRDITQSVGLDSLLQCAFNLSTLKSDVKQSMFENCIRALVGAIYLASGIEACQTFLVESSDKSKAETLPSLFTGVEKMVKVVTSSSDSQSEDSVESTSTEAFRNQFTTLTDVKIVRINNWVQHIRSVWSDSQALTRPTEALESLWIMHLGDAMINMVVAAFLIHTFPCSKDELLLHVQSHVTSNEQRILAARKAGIAHLLPLLCDEYEEEQINGSDKLARVFNTTLGFLFLENDGNVPFMTQILKHIMFPDILAVIDRREWQRSTQSFGHYLLSWDKQNHKRTRCTFKRLRDSSADSKHGHFTVALYVNDHMVARGRGISMSTAQDAACMKALRMFGLRRANLAG